MEIGMMGSRQGEKVSPSRTSLLIIPVDVLSRNISATASSLIEDAVIATDQADDAVLH